MTHPLATDPSSPFWIGLQDLTSTEATPMWVRVTCFILGFALLAVVLWDAWQSRGGRR